MSFNLLVHKMNCPVCDVVHMNQCAGFLEQTQQEQRVKLINISSGEDAFYDEPPRKDDHVRAPAAE